MKRCPACAESYTDEQKFCELDGTPLVLEPMAADRGSPEVARPAGAAPPVQRPRAWLTLIIGLALGAVACAAFIAAYRALTPERAPAPTQATKDVNEAPARPAPTARTTPPATPSAEPSVEATPSPSTSPTPPAPAPPQDDGLASLSDAPAATGGTGQSAAQPVRLRLIDGGVIEADEAWRTPRGIWYRRGSVVTLLERARLHSVERRPAPQPSPSAP
jgi:hypothetical protein